MIKRLALAFCLASLPAHATEIKEEIEGDNLEAFISVCLDEAEPNKSNCDFYIEGVSYGLTAGAVATLSAYGEDYRSPEIFSKAKATLGICPPIGATVYDDMDAVRAYLKSGKERPPRMEMLVAVALREAFPCE